MNQASYWDGTAKVPNYSNNPNLTEERSNRPSRWDRHWRGATGLLKLPHGDRSCLSVSEARGEAEQSAAADEGAKDTALLTLRPHQTCSEQLAD